MAKPRVIIADDHRLFAAGLERLLAPYCDIVASIYDGLTLLDDVRRLRPDVVVQDLSLPPVNGIDIIRQLKESGQLSPVVVIGLGTNGTITDGHMAALQQLLADRQRVIFLNLKVPRSWEAGDNAVIQKWVPQFGNAVLINWNGEGSLHPEFFYEDHIHLNTAGRARYADLIAAQINP